MASRVFRPELRVNDGPISLEEPRLYLSGGCRDLAPYDNVLKFWFGVMAAPSSERARG
jgi:hypothetical protein